MAFWMRQCRLMQVSALLHARVSIRPNKQHQLPGILHTCLFCYIIFIAASRGCIGKSNECNRYGRRTLRPCEVDYFLLVTLSPTWKSCLPCTGALTPGAVRAEARLRDKPAWHAFQGLLTEPSPQNQLTHAHTQCQSAAGNKLRVCRVCGLDGLAALPPVVINLIATQLRCCCLSPR